MSVDICIICKEEITKLSKEHIIPDSLLKNPDKPIITFDVCDDCNNKFGHTIDDEFLNDNYVKALKLIHKDFLKVNKFPRIKLLNFSNVTINDINYFLDLIIDEKGHQIQFSKKPTVVGNARYFMVPGKEAEAIINKYSAKPKVKLSISSFKIKPEVEFDLKQLILTKHMNPINFGVPLTRFVIKMALEYISMKFGKNIVLDEKFDICRKLIKRETDIYESMYKIIYITILPYEPENMEYVEHKIGLNFDPDNNFWFFYFSLYGLIEFYISVPNDSTYLVSEDVVKNYKHRKLNI